MQVNVNGDWQDWPTLTPLVVPWDPTGGVQPGVVNAYNRGCPPGYFAQYRPEGFVCRLADGQIMNDRGVTLTDEVGPTVYEDAIMLLADATGSVVENVGGSLQLVGQTVGAGLMASLLSGPGLLLAAAAGVLVFMYGMGRGQHG